MPGFNKLNTVPRNSGSRIFGSGDTFIINPSGAAGIGSTALVDENTTFYFSGKRNLRDKMNGRFVLSATGGTGGTHNGAAGTSRTGQHGCGDGGGGGVRSMNSSYNSGTGGAGGIPGGGGGGGAGAHTSNSGSHAGAGGTGARGEVRIMYW